MDNRYLPLKKITRTDNVSEFIRLLEQKPNQAYELYLSHSSIEEQEIKQLMAAVPSRANGLKLNFYGTYLGSPCIKRLAESLCHWPSDLELNLGQNDLDLTSLQVLISKLPHAASHLRLILNWNELGLTGANSLAEVLPFVTAGLQLVLQETKIETQAAKNLAVALANTQHLLELDLSYNHIGTEGAVSLAQGLSKQLLRGFRLGLCQNNINDAAAVVFAATLHNLPDGFQLDLSRNNISDAGVNEFANKLSAAPSGFLLNLSGNSAISLLGFKNILSALAQVKQDSSIQFDVLRVTNKEAKHLVANLSRICRVLPLGYRQNIMHKLLLKQMQVFLQSKQLAYACLLLRKAHDEKNNIIAILPLVLLQHIASYLCPKQCAYTLFYPKPVIPVSRFSKAQCAHIP